MLCSIYFGLYHVTTLLIPFLHLEVATTPMTLHLMRNENSQVDIYVADLYVYG
jgi:hypothetical protein